MNETQQPIRVFLVENHTLVRAGIHALLDSVPETTVIGEAGDGIGALAQMEQLALQGNLPDVVLMDLAMHGMGGLEATEKVKKAFPGVKIVILSMHASEEYVLQALRAGASGYLLKDTAPGELLQALQKVTHGEIPLSPAVSRHVIADYVRRVGSGGALPEGTVDARSLPQTLTPRQREILILIVEGLSTKEIAGRLGLSIKTVETHRAALMDRLDIRDIASLVRYAIRTGLVPPEE
jgi:DNA-binding NarL/FixJ family response regulator